MRRLNPPIDDVAKVYRQCASSVRDNEKKNRMLLIEPEIAAASEEYITAATNAALNEIPLTEGVSNTVSTNEMVSLYKTHMVRKRAAAREVYDRLMSSPRYNKCPLCGQRVVSTLDHHLPESRYPTFAVFPHNLVPACKDCNKEKGTAIPTDIEKQTIHPYFDDFETERWLYASVSNTTPVVLSFFVSPPNHWSEIKQRRAAYHFNILKLNKLFTAHAAEELANIRYYLTELYRKTGKQGVRDHLQQVATSRSAVQMNSWQTATYEAIASDDWFCDGGFIEN